MITIVFLLASLLVPGTAHAATDNTSPLPVPRFVSLRNGVVNMRTGPGFRYPIKWVYRRRNLPMEVTAEYDIWRRVRDPEGTEGWINKTGLSGRRYGFVRNGTQNLFDDTNLAAPLVAYLEKGALGKILSCTKDWCCLAFDDIKGCLPKKHFWGAYKEDIFD